MFCASYAEERGPCYGKDNVATPFVRTTPASEQHEVFAPQIVEPWNLVFLGVPCSLCLQGSSFACDSVIRGWAWYFGDADCCRAAFCSSFQCVIWMHLFRHVWASMMHCSAAGVFSRCAPTTPLVTTTGGVGSVIFRPFTLVLARGGAATSPAHVFRIFLRSKHLQTSVLGFH